MKKKHYFVLRNIIPVDIDAQYSFYVESSKPQPEDAFVPFAKAGVSRTKITELTSKERETNTFSYLDESKKERQCVLTMVSHDTQHDLPEKTDVCCFWCRHGFQTKPIGCPLQYSPHRVVKEYYSEITKDTYTLRENVTRKQLGQNTDHFQKHNMRRVVRDYYTTDGVFCSFNCCLAFIHANREEMYRYSESLLSHIYTRTFGEGAQPITPAPSWRLLRAYGGPLTIDEFRKGFYKTEYKDNGDVLHPPTRFKMVGFLYEKQVKI